MTIAEIKHEVPPGVVDAVRNLQSYVDDGSLQWIIVCIKQRGREPRVVTPGTGSGTDVLEMVGAMECAKYALLLDSVNDT